VEKPTSISIDKIGQIDAVKPFMELGLFAFKQTAGTQLLFIQKLIARPTQAMERQSSILMGSKSFMKTESASGVKFPLGLLLTNFSFQPFMEGQTQATLRDKMALQTSMEFELFEATSQVNRA
jgi:hypothetical protein